MHVQLTSKALAPALIPLTTFPNKNDICAKDLSRKEKKNIYQNIYQYAILKQDHGKSYWSRVKKILDTFQWSVRPPGKTSGHPQLFPHLTLGILPQTGSPRQYLGEMVNVLKIHDKFYTSVYKWYRYKLDLPFKATFERPWKAPMPKPRLIFIFFDSSTCWLNIL